MQKYNSENISIAREANYMVIQVFTRFFKSELNHAACKPFV